MPTGAPVAGAAVWIGVVAVAGTGLGELTLVDAMLLLAVVTIVPAAVPLHPAANGRTPAVALVAGLPVAPALLIEPGVAAALLVLPWLVLAVAGALAATMAWWSRGRALHDLVWVAAPAYLVVGAAWLLADRLELEPAGFAPPFVQLTAIHFHYAGFASALLVACAWRRLPASRTAAVAAIATVTAPPIIAVGFTFLGLLQVVGAALLTLGLWLLAWVTVRHVVPGGSRPVQILLVLSSLSVLVPMALAVQWAAGANIGTPALSIPDMARTHGVVNAIGFTLLGVLGWRLAHDKPPPADT